MRLLSHLTLVGCGQQPPVEATEETEAPTTQAPTTEQVPGTYDGEILADHVPAVLMLKNRSDKLDAVSEYDEANYAVKPNPAMVW